MGTPEAGQREPPNERELRDLEPQISAVVTALLEDGRFAIVTDQPHKTTKASCRKQRSSQHERRNR